MATDNSPVVTEEKLLYFYNTYLKPYINAESGGHAIKNENDLLPLEQRETMVLNTPLMGSDDSTNEATVLDVDTNVDLSVIHAPGTRTPDEFEVVITDPQEGQVMRYNATSEQWENGDNYHVYSTNEHVVGKWIDGRPVYEKVLDFGTLPNKTTKTVAHGISNLDNFIEIKTISKRSSDLRFYPIPFTAPDTLNIAVRIDSVGSNIRIQTEVDMSDFTQTFITMQYIKTSDIV